MNISSQFLSWSVHYLHIECYYDECWFCKPILGWTCFSDSSFLVELIVSLIIGSSHLQIEIILHFPYSCHLTYLPFLLILLYLRHWLHWVETTECMHDFRENTVLALLSVVDLRLSKSCYVRASLFLYSFCSGLL